MAIDEKKLDAALSGLQKFTDNWCMAVEETEKQGEPVFRCKECLFKCGVVCILKHFAAEHGHEVGCMSR